MTRSSHPDRRAEKGTPLVTGIAWNPLGQPTAWTWAFASQSLAASRSYDTAGRPIATEFSSYVYDAAGRITNLTQNLYGPGDADPTHSTIANADVTWIGTSRTYTVGATSNQLTGFTQSINGASTTSVTDGYNANGDLLSGGLRSYTYDAEGRLAAAHHRREPDHALRAQRAGPAGV